MSFRIKTHTWIEGILKFVEHEFEVLEEALLFGTSCEAHQVKVYDEYGEVIYSRTIEILGTYA
jgi:hypothetical protein